MDEEGVGGVLEEMPKAPFAHLERLLSLLALGYVTLVDYHALYTRIVQQVVQKEFKMAWRTILVQQLKLERLLHARLCPALGEYAPRLREIVWAYVVEDVIAYEDFSLVAH